MGWLKSNLLSVVAPVVGALLLLALTVATAEADHVSDEPILINVYNTYCTEVADINGCYDVYLCEEHPSYNALIAGISVTDDCLLVLHNVNPDGTVPNPSVPAVPTPDPVVISFTG